MGADGHRRRLPAWALEAGLGLGVVIAGLIVLGVVWRYLAAWLFGSGLDVEMARPLTVTTPAEWVAVALLHLGVFGVVGLGVPVAYAWVRGRPRPTILGRADREGAGWALGIGAVAAALIGGLSLLNLARGITVGGPQSPVPVALVGLVGAAPPQFAGEPAHLAFVGGLVVSSLGPGVVAGGLFHGVLQRSLGRETPAPVAIGATALALGAGFGGHGPAAFVVVVGVGAVAAVAYARVRTLWVPIVGYALLNASGLVISSSLATGFA